MNKFKPNSEKKEAPSKRNFISLLLETGNINRERVIGLIPFILFLFGIALLHISNRFQAEQDVRAIQSLDKELKELRWEYMTRKAELMDKSKQSEVAKRVEVLGLKESRVPPKKIELKKR